jgi:uncharacterized membrane protein
MIEYIVIFIPILFTTALLIRFYGDYGYDKPVKKSSKLVLEPPADISPSILGALLNPDGKPKEENFLAEILFLAYHGKIDINERYIKNKKQIVLLKHKKNVILDASEKIVFGYFFKKKNSIVLSDALRKSKRFRDCIMNWQAVAHKEARTYQHKYGWFHESKSKKIVKQIREWAMLALILSSPSLLFILNYGSFELPITLSIGFLLGIFISGLITIPISNYLFKRSKIGTNEYQKWMDYKSSLKNYFYLHKKPASSVAIWDKMIIYAVSLGVAKKAIYDMERVSFLKSDISSLLKIKLRL